MLIVYSSKITNRIRYIFKTVFTDILNVNIRFTDNVDEFNNSEDLKINYSQSKIEDVLFFKSHSLLFETGIKEQNIALSEFDGNPCFFPVGEESELPFDVFAASFYLIGRYEEYLPHIRDKHDRFMVSESLAYKHHFLKVPLVNIWIEEIVSIVERRYTDFKFPKRSFNFISTIDIDNAFAIKHKGFLRSLGSLMKSFLQPSQIKYKLSVLMSKEQDPFDTYKYIFDTNRKFNVETIFFFLLGDYGLYDKNVPIQNKKFQSLIKSIADYYTIGIHPSYKSNMETKMLNKEIKRLQNITHQDITRSRQHFLKLNLPDTYRNLIDNDIVHDYTMGYAEEVGFRASICSSYCFYDLDTESETKLWVHPFSVMESTFLYYKNMHPEEAVEEIIDLIQTIKMVKGTFISIWHNESFSERDIWKGWNTAYEKMITEALKTEQ